MEEEPAQPGSERRSSQRFTTRSLVEVRIPTWTALQAVYTVNLSLGGMRLSLGARTAIQKIAVETEHYKGNYPDRCSIDACEAAGALVEDLATGRVAWTEILPAAKLQADAIRVFKSELKRFASATHIRLNIYPDGGISRLRVFGRTVE